MARAGTYMNGFGGDGELPRTMEAEEREERMLLYMDGDKGDR